MPADPSSGRDPTGPSLLPLVATVLALAGVRRGRTVLDVCAGPGLCARAAAGGATETGLVVAVEPDDDLVRRGAAARGEPGWAPVHWLRAQPDALPLADDSVDAALCAPVPIRDVDLERVLPELRRVTRSGARVVVGGAAGSAAQAVALLGAHDFRLAHLSETDWAGAAVWHVAARRI